MSATPGPSPVRRDLANSTRDGIGWSVMVGLGETYIPAFALAVGLGPVAAGLVATVPLVVGAVLQVPGPAGAVRMGSLRRWVVALSAIQALCFLPLAAGAFLGRFPALPLFAVVSLYWGTGFATGPAWATWIETLVPRPLRARYFGRRGVLTNGALLVSILAGGWVLDAAEEGGAVLTGFALLFLGAGLGRAVSTRFLQLHREVWKPACRVVGAGEILRRVRHTPAGRLLLFMTALQVAVFVAYPFLNPYMLDCLGLPYLDYMVLVSATFLARMVSLPLLGRAADRVGPRGLLLFAGVGYVPVTALWILSDRFAWLLALQALWGVLGAAFELAVLILYFETMPREERMGVLTWFNLVNAAALVAGSLAGGALLDALGGSREAYHWIFGASAALRLLCLPLLFRIPQMPVPFPFSAFPLRWLFTSGEARR